MTEMIKKRITIVGGGFVGMAYADLLSEKHNVTVVDKSQEKVDAILSQGCAGYEKCDGFVRMQAEHPTRALTEDSIRATADGHSVYSDADYVIIAVPTNPAEDSDELDCSAVQEVIEDVLNATDHALIVIKSTVPIGFTQSCAQMYGTDRIIYNPEFLREISAQEDCRHPDRIVVGTVSGSKSAAEEYASLLQEAIGNSDAPILYMTSSEAEAVKLFSNTYLAMRVAFFNELDSFAEAMDLDTATVIHGVCSDKRIGDYYNNPSFGYGGTCLPKDVGQLQTQIKDVQGELIGAIGASNRSRQERIADSITSQLFDEDSVVGIYRLGMQSSSNNFRQSSVIEIIKRLKERDITTIIYEPCLGDEKQFLGCEVIADPDTFKRTSDLIITNRYDTTLDDVRAKVYTRDKNV